MIFKKMADADAYSIFKKSSKTFFASSRLFPAKVQTDVFTLYAFLRLGDDFVDTLPQQKEEYFAYKKQYYSALQGIKTENTIVNDFARLVKKYDLPGEWIDAFFASMEMDLTKKTYKTLPELLTFIYGAAEIVGLCMAKILGLPPVLYMFAESLGRVVQMVNIMRSIPEDLALGRTYFPKNELRTFGLHSLEYEYVHKHPKKYRSFMEFQSKRVMGWYEEAQLGFPRIPWRVRWPIKTASDLYYSTLQKIMKNPFRVYTDNLKPTSAEIYTRAFGNFFILEKLLVLKRYMTK